ncbi:hypothetical protein CHS0354_000442 [Potamilus streckersoni]|uniref:Glutamyl-tRNA(Gln) amidotransferase subunit A, mitochondrial n=1 Tax=Potamilus streckersoni TaxID=2493646 RepID=A0AAE0W8A3_9BIVA|nr:hypothetical protein CHS0354_000442 [Potamilus streckersoni]
MTYKPYHELRRSLNEGTITCREVVEHYLNVIQQTAHLNIYLSVFTKRAIEKADLLDMKRHKGAPLGKLFGMCISIKDNIAIKEERLTCGSKMLENYTSLFNATVVERLEREDALILGKVNMDEFAMGSSNETSAFGATKNFINEDYVPGGSSGGSAVAVSSGTCMVALGTDTGGSVRQPASFCNVIGLKPTYGRVSRYGLVAFASSFDQIGVLSHSASDAALVSEVISGYDERDSTSSQSVVPSYSIHLDDLNVEIRCLIEAKLEALQSRGATLVPISLPHISYSLATYYILTTAEASSNLARYDGVRYGYRDKEASDLMSMYVQSRNKGFGKEVKRRIMLGTYVLSSGYYDAYFKKAQQVRRLIRDDFMKVFEKVDVVVSPTSPSFPFKFGEKASNPIDMYLADTFTVGVNLAGIPAVSIPAGLGTNGLPVGIQFMGKAYDEQTILNMCHFFETHFIA